MIDYIKENCELPPIESPLYDADTETWDLYFEEKGNHHPYLRNDLVCLPFDTQGEAKEVFAQSIALHEEQQRALAEEKAKREAEKKSKD